MDQVTAERELVAEPSEGPRFALVVRIGIPQPGPHDSWVCAASIDGLSHRPLDAHGMDSMQALLLAIKNVRIQLDRFITHGGKLFLVGDEEAGCMSVSELFGDDA